MYRKSSRLKMNRCQDPYWLVARFGTCSNCGCSIRGQSAFYFPNGKTIYCKTCGEVPSNEFMSSKFDEAVYNGKTL